MTDPLSAGQVEEFVERGFTVLRRAFSAQTAHTVRDALGKRIGVDLDDPAQWRQPRIFLRETIAEAPFTDALTDRFVNGVDQLAGPGRWRLVRRMGSWPVTFPGFADPGYGDDWHVEGTFRHHIWSPEQVILPLFCFSTVEPGGGGTLIAEGSHRVAARLLRDSEPAGLEPDEIWPAMNTLLDRSGWHVTEITAEEGDIVLAHPLAFHSSNPNHGIRPRVMAQPRFDMTEPKRISGPDLSPVERALA